jgi:hypothetical protein
MKRAHINMVPEASIGKMPGDDHLSNPAIEYACQSAAALNTSNTATNTSSPRLIIGLALVYS